MHGAMMFVLGLVIGIMLVIVFRMFFELNYCTECRTKEHTNSVWSMLDDDSGNTGREHETCGNHRTDDKTAPIVDHDDDDYADYL